jgi:hypothetical protein
MRQFVHDVAALPVRVVPVIMYDGPSHAAWYGHCRKCASLDVGEVRNSWPEGG